MPRKLQPTRKKGKGILLRKKLRLSNKQLWNDHSLRRSINRSRSLWSMLHPQGSWRSWKMLQTRARLPSLQAKVESRDKPWNKLVELDSRGKVHESQQRVWNSTWVTGPGGAFPHTQLLDCRLLPNPWHDMIRLYHYTLVALACLLPCLVLAAWTRLMHEGSDWPGNSSKFVTVFGYCQLIGVAASKRQWSKWMICNMRVQ